MLAIPNLCATGHVVGFKFRVIDPDYNGPTKYDKPAGMSNRLFNLRALNDPGSLICITEGEIDAISVTQLGFPTVGIQGVKSWKAHHPALFEGYERIVVVRDVDDAGFDLGRRLLDTDLPVVVVEPPAADANEALRLGLGDQLAKAIRGE
jgi:DNA primase